MRKPTPRAVSRAAGAALAAALVLAVLLSSEQRGVAAAPRGRGLTTSNASGVLETFTRGESIDMSNAFFQELGSNGRSCATCHRPAEGWSITPGELQERFARTGGLDPIFRTNDGSNCEGAVTSTLQDRRDVFSLLLTKGLIRTALEVPAGAEFEIVAVDDPYSCGAPLSWVSMFRRPLPTTNLAFLSAIMWDGRETLPGRAIRDGLAAQVDHATTGHAEGNSPSAARIREIVDFELGLFTAQTHDRGAGALTARGARGGPQTLANEPFCIGINDPLHMVSSSPGACLSKNPVFNPAVFTLFGAWDGDASPERRAIARGEALFNTRQFVIDNVPGLNGGPQDPVPCPIQTGTCSLCHDTPNAGNHSIAMPLNIGIADASRRSADLPLYTLRNLTTGDLAQTTDPGRAMVTGKWRDIGKFKGPILRALAARAPYFHNGAAATLEEVVEFYETRFHLGLTEQERADLVAFLRSL